MDNNLTMSQHITNVCKAAYIELRRIASIRRYLTTEAAKTLVCAFVLSKLDYCNALCAGCPLILINKLQRVQNYAARLILKVRYSDHITPHLHELHWLPVSARIQYKVSTVTYNCIASSCPDYLSSLLSLYVPSRQNLRSAADTRVLRVPLVKTKSYGQRTFAYQSSVVWNSLPYDLRHAESTASFKRRLKTHLFSMSYPSV